MIIPKSEDFSVFAPSYNCENGEYDTFISDLQLQTLIYSKSTDIIFIQQNPCLDLNRNSATLEWTHTVCAPHMKDVQLQTAGDKRNLPTAAYK